MNKYQVSGKVHAFITVTVYAENEEEAREIAFDKARLYNASSQSDIVLQCELPSKLYLPLENEVEFDEVEQILE